MGGVVPPPPPPPRHLLIFVVGTVFGWSAARRPPRARWQRRYLAPREVLCAEFAGLDRTTPTAVASVPQIAALLDSGDIERCELEEIFGHDMDADGFVKACYAIAELFEDEGPTAREEVMLAAGQGEVMGERIMRGNVVVCLPEVATQAECRRLVDAGVASHAQHRSRLSVSTLCPSSVDIVESVLLRVMDRIDADMPSVFETLFRPSDHWASRQPRAAPPRETPRVFGSSLRELFMAGELEWSEGEPAINVYTRDGHFGAHKDHLALTVLVPLTDPSEFSGGGTGFWPPDVDYADGENPKEDPVVLRPEKGTALVFGGDVTHAGIPVDSGLRSVLVASFSTRAPDSPADRLNGLQPGTTSLHEHW